jgi:hypothetical protein
MERVNPKNSSYPEKPVDFDVVADAGATESTSVAKAATNTPIFINFLPRRKAIAYLRLLVLPIRVNAQPAPELPQRSVHGGALSADRPRLEDRFWRH